MPHETSAATRHLIYVGVRPLMENARREVTELLASHGDQLVGLVSAQLGAGTLDEVDARAACARRTPVPGAVVLHAAGHRYPGPTAPVALRGLMRSMKDRMLRGELYLANDPELRVELARAQALLERYNHTTHVEQDERDRLLRELLGAVGEGVVVKPTLRCDYGTPITIGAGTFVNYDCVFLDVAPITIGAYCQFATRVQLLTATHPIDPEPRRIGWEYGQPITVADNVWLGGGVIVCPGVTIGQDTVVGAGAVVTRDLPRGVVAVGAPARVVRQIGDHDRIEMPDR